MSDSTNDSKGFLTYFTNAYAENLKTNDVLGIKGVVTNVKNSGTEALARTAADMAIEETQVVVNQIKEDSKEIIAQTAQNLSPESKDTWNLIRENIAPSGGFFKTIFARLLWIGAKIGSFVGAIFVDTWTGRDEKAENISNIDIIFSWLIGKTFGKPDEDTENNLSPLISRKPGVPKGWLNNSPIPVSN